MRFERRTKPLQLDKKQIGLRIKSIRESFGWNLEEFGELVFEASKGTVSNWENGVNIPSKKRLERISVISKKDVNWILHGDMNSYVKRLFSYMKPIMEFDEVFYNKLVQSITENKLDYEDVEGILKLAVEIKPELRENEHFHYLLKNLGTSIEKVSYYDIEENVHYRNVYLPMLSTIFKQEEDIEEIRQRFNDQILLRVMDILQRLNYENKKLLNELITELSWTLTKNIFITDKSYMPTNFASLGGFKATDEKTMFGEREYDEAKEEYILLRESILKKLDEIFVANAKDFYENRNRY